MSPGISVVIPALNEAEHLSKLLAQLTNQQGVQLELIIVDGGSTDETHQIAAQFDTTLLKTKPGRGHQLNRGAAEAHHDWLFFLHADSALTNNRQLADALRVMQASDSAVAGHFPLEFKTDDLTVKKALRFFEAKTRYNRPGTFNGDQGLLLERQHFEALTGFSETYHFLEDQEFAVRFNRYGSFITLPHVIITSGRRFETEGVRERVILNTLIMAMFHLGQSAFFDRAAGIYKQQEYGSKLNPAPFMALVQSCLFADGFRTGVKRCYRIGRYATHNLWQPVLLAGLRYHEPERSLRGYDRYIRPVTNNPLGYLIGTVFVVSWFFTTRVGVVRRRHNS